MIWGRSKISWHHLGTFHISYTECKRWILITADTFGNIEKQWMKHVLYPSFLKVPHSQCFSVCQLVFEQPWYIIAVLYFLWVWLARCCDCTKLTCFILRAGLAGRHFIFDCGLRRRVLALPACGLWIGWHVFVLCNVYVCNYSEGVLESFSASARSCADVVAEVGACAECLPPVRVSFSPPCHYGSACGSVVAWYIINVMQVCALARLFCCIHRG